MNAKVAKKFRKIARKLAESQGYPKENRMVTNVKNVEVTDADGNIKTIPWTYTMFHSEESERGIYLGLKRLRRAYVR